jgi:nicotinamide riboside kinase
MSVRIAIIGAESTGKSSLAQALATALAAAPASGAAAWRVALVAETLREWCDREGRTPRADEQSGIMAEHHRRIEQAALQHDIVLCDTTALMTAVYSRTVFGDRSLEAQALSLHRSMQATLLTALDLPWVSDGLQRSGEHVRQPVDAAVRELLMAHGVGFSVIGGSGDARSANALAALAPLLRGLVPQAHQTSPATLSAQSTQMPQAPNPPRGPQKPHGLAAGAGAFSKLLAAPDSCEAAASSKPTGHAAAWSCACCSVPEFERALARGAVPYAP